MLGFSSLPSVLGASIIIKWIKLKDFVRLDSACNSHLARSAFLCYCQSETIKIEYIQFVLPEQIQWFINRQLKFRKMSTTFLEWQEGINELMGKLLACVGSHVRDLCIFPDCSFSDKNVVYLNTIIAQSCRNIQKIEILGEISDFEVAPLFTTGESIQVLEIFDCKISDTSFYTIANICENLKHLYLECIKISDVGLTALAGKCPELLELRIFHCKSVTAKGLIALLLTTPKLLDLRMRISTLLDADMAIIAQHCHMLHTVDLTTARLITDVGIQALVSHCTQLSTIHLSKCIKIASGFCLFRNLHELNIYDCPTLTDTMVTTIVQNNPLLKHLILFYCPLLTSAAVLHILHGCPHLHILTVTNNCYDPLSSHSNFYSLVMALISDQYPNITSVQVHLK